MPKSPTRPKEKFLDFGSPAIEDAQIEEVMYKLKSGWLGTCPEVIRFETGFGEYKDWGYAVAVNSSTAALRPSLLAVQLEPRDEILCSATAFCDSIHATIDANASPFR